MRHAIARDRHLDDGFSYVEQKKVDLRLYLYGQKSRK